MKKNGFTLAEVLITLAIIGVVATLTLPALMTNTAEQQAISAFKKGLNTLTEAGQMNSAVEGFDYSGTTQKSEVGKATEGGNVVQSIWGLLHARASVDVNKSRVLPGSPSYRNLSGNFVVFFRDGSCLSFKDTDFGTVDNATKAVQADGLPYGVKAIYDINGTKSPNQLSNCQGEFAANTDVSYSNAKDLADKCVKEKRVIKDQFGVRLRGSYAVPNGAAAAWTAAQ